MVYPRVHDFPIKLKPNITRWVVPGWYGGGTTTSALVAGRLYQLPIFVEETTIYIRIAIEVTVAAAGGSLARLGIYNWQDGVPGSLILDAGTVPTDAVAVQQIVIAQALRRRHYYFLALVADNTPTLKEAIGSTYRRTPVPGQSTTFGALRYDILYTDGRAGDVAGGLADPAPAPDGVDYRVFTMLREN